MIQVVHVQASRWNTPDAARFTIDLNVVLPAFHESWTGTPMPKNPASAAPICSYRIGLLMEDGKDRWWEVSANSNIATIGKEVVEAIRDLGLPALNEASNLDWLLEKLRTDERFSGTLTSQPLATVILLHHVGRRREALQTITELRNRNKHSGFAKTIDTIEARLIAAGDQ